MSNLTWLRPPWLFNRRIGIALLWTLLLVGVATTVNVAGIRLVGGIEGWKHWLQAHARHFLVWRLLLYAATAYGWWWMRRRLSKREPQIEVHRRLLRVELAAVTAIVVLEAGRWLRPG